ncbi:MAG: phosphate/phosphite/phosphonate ABC transporter substrate-binding protein [Pseudomonadota bacterium]
MSVMHVYLHACLTLRAKSVLAPLAAVFWLVLPGLMQAAPNELKFGVFPQLSTRVMVETYQPLVDFLGETIGQTLRLESAKDFHTFHLRTMGGEYDLVLTAPHLAWLAWKEGGYRPLLVYGEPAKGFIVVRTDSPYRKPGDLRGKTIAIPDSYAVVNIRLTKMLASSGLNPGREIAVTEVGSHTNAAAHVYERQSEAAIVGVFPFLRLPGEMRKGLRIIAQTPDLPSHVFLVHTRLAGKREKSLELAIGQFMRSEEGAAFLQKNGFGGVRALKKDELKQVEGDARELLRRFQAQPGAAGEKK